MSTNTTNTESMKEAMTKALQQSIKPTPSIISNLFLLLNDAQEALRAYDLSNYKDAVLELRQGLQTDYGLRYTAYIRNTTSTFESPLFSIFVDDAQCAFQAEGQLQSSLNAEQVIDMVRDYPLQPHVVEFMTGLLRQFK